MRSPTSPSRVRREAGEDSDQQHLQQVALHERADEGVRDDAHQVLDEAFVLGARHIGGDRLRVERGRIDVEAGARLDDLADQQADAERDGRDHLEINQRLDADPAEFLQVAHAGDAVHHGAEDHRRDHHLDQRDEAVAERFERLAEIRIEMPDRDADHDRDQHLDVEHRVPGAMVRIFLRANRRRGHVASPSRQPVTKAGFIRREGWHGGRGSGRHALLSSPLPWERSDRAAIRVRGYGRSMDAPLTPTLAHGRGEDCALARDHTTGERPPSMLIAVPVM